MPIRQMLACLTSRELTELQGYFQLRAVENAKRAEQSKKQG